MKYLHKIHKFLRLTKSDRYLLITTVLLLNGVRLGLWLLPFQTLRHLLIKLSLLRSPHIPLDSSSEQQLAHVTWAIGWASKYTFGEVKCLARALTAQVLFNQKGYPSSLQIGVAKNHEGKLEAHAWIERQGKVLIGNLQDLSRYKPLPSLEGETF